MSEWEIGCRDVAERLQATRVHAAGGRVVLTVPLPGTAYLTDAQAAGLINAVQRARADAAAQS